MTKFESIGISIQLESVNKSEALQSFKQSCTICSHRGLFIKCDRCGIAQAHREVVAVFDDQEALNS